MKRIKELRIDNDIKVKDIARYLNVKYQQYQKYEKNVTPRLDIFIMLSKFYNTSIDYIVELTDNPIPYPRKKER